MPGELEGDHVIVRDQSEANRIYNKGGYGRPLSGGALDLDLVEAAYLVGAGRLKMAKPHESLASLLAAAGRVRPEFGIELLAYRDLREQYHELRLTAPSVRAKGIQFRAATKDGKTKPTLFQALSERTPASLAALFAFGERANADQAGAVVAVVDEESEVTQYSLSLPTFGTATRAAASGGEVDGLLLGDRLFVPSGGASDELHEREFFGKPAPGGYYLSLVEGLHLVSRGVLRVTDAVKDRRLKPEEFRRAARAVEPGLELRGAVYEDLKSRGLVVKTGYKFGTHFRAYEDDPRKTHAPWLVESTKPDAVFEWPQLSRAIRLAHGVRKRLLLAEASGKSVRYVGLERLR